MIFGRNKIERSMAKSNWDLWLSRNHMSLIRKRLKTFILQIIISWLNLNQNYNTAISYDNVYISQRLAREREQEPQDRHPKPKPTYKSQGQRIITLAIIGVRWHWRWASGTISQQEKTGSPCHKQEQWQYACKNAVLRRRYSEKWHKHWLDLFDARIWWRDGWGGPYWLGYRQMHEDD